ncbi:MAG: hypothetical protein EXS49_00265 [Candidatus Pacebacteria bacterium]|nr:hypothetical protein [Candidatus Paceibacterota bacterium]
MSQMDPRMILSGATFCLRDGINTNHVLAIVIHAENRSQVMRNVGIAFDAGVKCVFLIGHGMTYATLLQHFFAVRKEFKTSKGPGQGLEIGVNFLDLSGEDAIRLAVMHKIFAVWIDDGGIREDEEDPCRIARVNMAIKGGGIPGLPLIFGGVAFKHQTPVRDLTRVARLAIPFMEVITTSGEATGSPPDPEKIRAIRGAIGNHALAIASGITPDNVQLYLPNADIFLVATGVSKSHTELDPVLVRRMVGVMPTKSR